MLHLTSGKRETLLDGGSEALAATVQVGTNGVERQVESCGDAFVTEVFLMVKDEDGAFRFRKGEEGLLDKRLRLVVGKELFRGTGVLVNGVRRLVLKPGGRVLVACAGGGLHEMLPIAAASGPLILGDVDGDAVKVGRKLGIAAKVRESAIKAEEDLLGEIFDVHAGTGEAMQRAEDSGLVLADEYLEAFRGCIVAAHACMGGYDREGSGKFHAGR